MPNHFNERITYCTGCTKWTGPEDWGGKVVQEMQPDGSGAGGVRTKIQCRDVCDKPGHWKGEGGSARRCNGRSVASIHGSAMGAHMIMPKVTYTNSSSFISIAFDVREYLAAPWRPYRGGWRQ